MLLKNIHLYVLYIYMFLKQFYLAYRFLLQYPVIHPNNMVFLVIRDISVVVQRRARISAK